MKKILLMFLFTMFCNVYAEDEETGEKRPLSFEERMEIINEMCKKG